MSVWHSNRSRLQPPLHAEKAPGYKTTMWLLWAGYAVYYLGRANLSLALPSLLDHHNLSYVAAGAITTSGYLLYALGQPLNGMLIDRLGAKRFFIAGMLVSALMNLSFSATSGIWFMMVLWGANGYAQACGWPSLVKIADHWLPIHSRGKAMGVLATSAHVGSVLSWSLASLLVATLGWRYVFWVPAIVMGFMCLSNFLFLREKPTNTPTTVQEPLPAPAISNRSHSRPLRMLSDPHIRWAALLLACINLILNSLMTWVPTYMADSDLSAAHVGWRVTLFPVMSTIGTLWAGWLFDTRRPDRKMSLLMPIHSGLFLALLFFLWAKPNSTLALASLVLIGLTVAAANFLLTGPVPMQIANGTDQAATVGLIDGIGYIGASIGSLLTGWLAQHYGWDAAITLWIATSAFACVGAFLFSKNLHITPNRTRPDNT